MAGRQCLMTGGENSSLKIFAGAEVPFAEESQLPARNLIS